MSQPDERQPDEKDSGAIRALSTTKTAIEAITSIIGAVSAVVGFVVANGGLVSILVQVGVFAFACYIAVIPAVLVLSAFDALGESIKRETKEAVQLVVGIVLILLFALLIRLFVFYDGIGTDFDAFGRAFAAAVGVAALLLPLLVLWYFYGSKPSSP